MSAAAIIAAYQNSGLFMRDVMREIENKKKEDNKEKLPVKKIFGITITKFRIVNCVSSNYFYIEKKHTYSFVWTKVKKYWIDNRLSFSAVMEFDSLEHAKEYIENLCKLPEKDVICMT